MERAGGFSQTDVFLGEYVVKDSYPQVLVPGSLDILDPEVVYLTSRADGADIEIGFFRPATTDQVPVIVFASPYIYSGMSPPSDLMNQGEYRRLVLNYVPHGYAVAFVPVRGTSDAGGCMDLMGPLERADLDQAITWLGEADWSNGNTAIIGLSYSGSTAWQVAATGNPHLKTIVTVSGVNDWFHLIYKNGTSEERGWGSIVSSYYTDFGDYNPATGTRSPTNTATAVACPTVAQGIAASEYSLATGERDPNGFWDDRNQRPGVEANYNGSIFVIQGLLDRNVDPSNAYPWVNQLESRGIVVKHLLGQWGHEFPDRPDANGNVLRPDTAEIFLHWFDYWLKDNNGSDLGPVAQVQDNRGHWRSEDAWPPTDAAEKTLYLTPEGRLAANASSQTGQHLIAISGHEWFPTSAGGLDEQCLSCATFTSDVFDQETRVAGVPRVPVTVVPTTTAGSIAASLYIVQGSDREAVGGGAINLRFADGGETPRDLTPGQAVVAKMVLEPLDIVVPSGAQLELLFHQGSYTDHLPVVPTAPVYLQSGGEQSVLVLKTFRRDAADLFEPPVASIS